MTIKQRNEGTIHSKRKTNSALKGNMNITNTFSNKLTKKISGIGSRTKTNPSYVAQPQTLYSHVVMKEGHTNILAATHHHRQFGGEINIPY
mmetsp:Transcript_31085/g.47470  ORF Transcript_31085/g.47470 Transcript_31085/m.47470 type:complete len:91 (-) Transcript_31085:8-280(-)